MEQKYQSLDPSLSQHIKLNLNNFTGQIRGEIKSSLEKGFFHIFASQGISKVTRFLSVIFVVRILTKDLYGTFSYAQNLLQMFLLINGLGVVPAILQFCCEQNDHKKKLSYLKYGIRIGLLFNIVVVSVILSAIQVFSFPLKGSEHYLSLLLLMPLVLLIFEMISVYLRVEFRNREFSFFNITNTLLYFIGTVVGGYFFSAEGIIFGRYISFIVVIAWGIYLHRAEISEMRKTLLLKAKEKKEFLKFAVIVSMTNAVGQTLYLLDVFFVGLIIKVESTVAAYKTATIIPFALAFIPQSIMMFVYPYFAKNAKDKTKLKKYFYKIQNYLIALNSAITIFLLVFARQIIEILFGMEYQDSILPFRILCLGFFISSSFRILPGNLLASLRKVNINLINSIFCGVANIVLDVILIKKYGSVGAAVATTVVFFLSTLIANGYLYFYFRKKSVPEGREGS